jgi:gas vesicle protein
MNDRTSYLPSLFSFLAGTLAGAGVALLVAPQAGKVTRAMLRRKLDDTAGAALQMKEGVVRRGEAIRDEASHRITDAASALAGHGPRSAASQGEGRTST